MTMSCSKISLTIYLICFASLVSFAQQFKYTAQLNRVDSTGFYAITIGPQLSAYIKTDFADIRIIDKNKQWVPHLLQAGSPVLMDNLFTTFPILQNTVTDSGKNLLVIENTIPEGIYSLKLFLKNAAVSRTAILSGSDNQHEWFIIDDKISIARSYEMVKDEYLQEINFPLTKYRYLKIVIDNLRNDPLFITKAGFYTQPGSKKITQYLDNPPPTFSQKDSNNYSYVEVRQGENYQFDRIAITISGSKFYNRDLQICLPGFGKTHAPGPASVIGNFKLLSAMPAIFEVPRTKTSSFFIIIKNADNPPLKIEKVSTQQQPVSLVTYLQKGEKYNLVLGDSLALFADYDLQSFKDSISVVHPLNYENVQAIAKVSATNPINNTNRWVWAAIIFAGVVLSFLTYRLTGDINKSKK